MNTLNSNSIQENPNTKIAIICDMHLPADTAAPQHIFLQRAIAQMKQDGITHVLCLGDICAYGELSAWETYQQAMEPFTHYEVLGNSDVRDASTKDFFLNQARPITFSLCGRRFFGIRTPYGEISEEDRAFLGQVQSSDILLLHHYIDSLQEDSRAWLNRLAEQIPLTILHGHKHERLDYYIGKTHVIGLPGLDPDKSIGNFPSIDYLNISEQGVQCQPEIFELPKDILKSIHSFLGLSCVDNARDIAYATEHNVKYIELRCNGNWTPDPEVLPMIETWRQKTNGYLSVHMPNLTYREDVYSGMEQWQSALDYAIAAGADSFTMHPPKVSLCDFSPQNKVWNTLLEQYLLVARSVAPTVKLGIENLHKGKNEVLDEHRGFGYTPEEVSAWIDALNEILGEKRIGHVLDVGHARNNGKLAQQYPISRWMQLMGKKTIAYHIHQVVKDPNGLKNHRPLEDWFGPMINYTSFFYYWEQEMLNHVPVFLEVKGCENFEKSVQAFEALLQNNI